MLIAVLISRISSVINSIMDDDLSYSNELLLLYTAPNDFIAGH